MPTAILIIMRKGSNCVGRPRKWPLPGQGEAIAGDADRKGRDYIPSQSALILAVSQACAWGRWDDAVKIIRDYEAGDN